MTTWPVGYHPAMTWLEALAACGVWAGLLVLHDRRFDPNRLRAARGRPDPGSIGDQAERWLRSQG